MKTLQECKDSHLFSIQQIDKLDYAERHNYPLEPLTKLTPNGIPVFDDLQMERIIGAMKYDIDVPRISMTSTYGGATFNAEQMYVLLDVALNLGRTSILSEVDEHGFARFSEKDMRDICDYWRNGQNLHELEYLSEADISAITQDWWSSGAKRTAKTNIFVGAKNNTSDYRPEVKRTSEHLAYIKAGKDEGIDLTKLPVHSDGTPVFNAAQTAEILKAYQSGVSPADFMDRSADGQPKYRANAMRILRTVRNVRRYLAWVNLCILMVRC